MIRAIFTWNNLHLRLFCITTLGDWLKKMRHFLNQSEVEPKPMMIRAHTFSRASSRLHVFSLSCDWFTGLSASLVIGHSDYFGASSTTLNRKSLYACTFAVNITVCMHIYLHCAQLLCGYDSIMWHLFVTCAFSVDECSCAGGIRTVLTHLSFTNCNRKLGMRLVTDRVTLSRRLVTSLKKSNKGNSILVNYDWKRLHLITYHKFIE